MRSIKDLSKSKNNICVLCSLHQSRSRTCCKSCLNDLPWIQHSCYQCGIPLVSNALRCGQCLKTPPPYQRVYTACLYQFPIDQLISATKYQGRVEYIPLLTELFLEKTQLDQIPDVLIPVPIHRQKMSQRLFNHTALMAKLLGKALDIPIDLKLLIKSTATPAQHQLSKKQRLKNLKGSFSLTRNHCYSHIAIIDDVMTTGSTLHEIATLLQAAHDCRVDGWMIARTPH